MHLKKKLRKISENEMVARRRWQNWGNSASAGVRVNCCKKEIQNKLCIEMNCLVQVENNILLLDVNMENSHFIPPPPSARESLLVAQ